MAKSYIYKCHVLYLSFSGSLGHPPKKEDCTVDDTCGAAFQ